MTCEYSTFKQFNKLSCLHRLINNISASFHWSEEVTQQIREDFKEWITLPTGNRLPRKKDLEKYVERNNIGCSILQLRTKIMNEQYKRRKIMEKKIKKLKG